MLTSAYTFQHTYTNNDSLFTLCVSAQDQAQCFETECQTISLTPCGALQAVFTQTQLPQGNVLFYGTTSNSGPIAYLWNFGDGQTGFGQAVEHLFPNQGVYNVCLTVVDSITACSNTICQPVNVQGSCQTLFNNPSIQVNNLVASVNSFTTGGCGNYTYTWTVPEIGLSGTNQNFNITFPQAGSYNLIITVSDLCGCTFTGTYPINATCNTSGTNPISYNMQGGVVTTCNMNLYDSAGPSASYSNNENMTLTVYPASAGGKVKVQFVQFNVETNWDFLYIHNGNSVNAPLMATLTGSPAVSDLIYTSTATDGSLTFQWSSDASVVSPGWQASVTCTDLEISMNDLGNGILEFTANSQQNWDNYSWTANGVAFGGTTNVVNGSFAAGSNVEICVTATNSAGCSSTACDWVSVPCDYNVEFDYVITGNEVEVTITNPIENYVYGGFAGQTQSWVNFDDNNSATFAFFEAENTQICIYGEGSGCYDSTCVNIEFDDQQTANLGGFVWVDENGNGLLDAGEETLPNTYVMLCAGTDTSNCIYTVTDENGFYSFDVFPGTYNLHALIWLQNHIPTLPSGGDGYTFTISEGDTITGFDFGYQNQSVTIEGFVFYDLNNNGFQDGNEGPAAYKQVMVGNFALYTNAQGEFSISLLAGTYSVSLNTNGLGGYVVSLPAGGSYTVNASTVGLTYGGNVFGLWADPDFQDLTAFISPISTITPGFPFMASLGYCNNGLIATDGSFTYYWDPAMEITLASEFSPAPSVFNAEENFATWNFSNLGAGSCGYIYMHPDMPVSLQLGANMFNTVLVTPLADANPTNNIDTLHMTVVGSWDPNDKQGTPAGIGEDGKILPNTQLSYTIRFQNTGTAPAVNVVLIDTLTSELVLETFDMISSSHPYSVQVDNANRVIRWTFTNIMLPDSTSDPLGSIGYVRFSMNPIQNQPDGTVINNFADIYFDFNEPIRTNTTVHTIDRFLSVNDIHNDNDIRVFPNPFKGSTRFWLAENINESLQLEITDMLGRRIDSFVLKGSSYFDYEASHLSAGMYMYRITGSGLDKSGKLIVK
jgi:uncharacterized repeat protein (TIGR01451 family)